MSKEGVTDKEGDREVSLGMGLGLSVSLADRCNAYGVSGV